jgi:hypothetical protein
VLEHPADSHAWETFGVAKPERGRGWLRATLRNEPLRFHTWTCYVEQGQYGHAARKGTWLLYVGKTQPFELNWARGEQQLDPIILARHGYEYARRKGMVSMVGGKDKTKIRNATPPAFRDVLLRLAEYSRLPNIES